MSSLSSKFSIAESLDRLSSWSKDMYVNRINSKIKRKKDTSPILRMYYDSPLSSNIEQTCEKIRASEIYHTIRKFIPNNDNELNEKVVKYMANRIAHIDIKRNDSSKLKYQYCKGIISHDEYLRESSKRFVIATITLVKKVVTNIVTPKPIKKVLKPIKKVVEKLIIETSPEFKELKNGSTNVKNKLKEKAADAVYKARKDFSDGVRKLVNYVDEKIDKTREKTKEFADNLSQKLGYDNFSNFKDSVKETAKEYTKKVIDKATDAGKSVIKWVKNIFRR